MAKVVITCGKLCSGKTTYAEALSDELPAVHFSIDDLTLLLLGPYPGDILDEYFTKLEGYFYEQCVKLARRGINSVIDLGLWTKKERIQAREYFREKGVECEIHYLKIEDNLWHKRIEKRNRDIEDGAVKAYYVDENLLKKFESWFEEPEPEEVDKIICCKDEK